MTLASRLAEYVSAGFSGLWIQSFEQDDAIAEMATLPSQSSDFGSGPVAAACRPTIRACSTGPPTRSPDRSMIQSLVSLLDDLKRWTCGIARKLIEGLREVYRRLRTAWSAADRWVAGKIEQTVAWFESHEKQGLDRETAIAKLESLLANLKAEPSLISQQA